jgi:hypothetical protein
VTDPTYDQALRAVAGIVHEADLGDERFDAPEAPRPDVLVRSLDLLHPDQRLLDLTAPLFDELCAEIQARVTVRP